MSPADALRDIPPFDRMSDAERGRTAREAAWLSLRKGKALYWQGDRTEAVFLLASGSVRSVMYRSDESTIEMGRSGRGEWLGLAETLLGCPRLNDAIAEEACELLSFTRAGFERFLGAPGMRSFFLRELSRRYCALHSQIELRTPIDRLARFLLARCAGAGEVACTQEEIAEAVGVTRETVNRHLARLQDKGVLKVGRGSIRIVDAEGLKGIPGFRVGLISMI